MVRRIEGGGSAPRPRMGIVQARERAEKRATTRLREKSSLEVVPSIATTAGGLCLARYVARRCREGLVVCCKGAIGRQENEMKGV